MLQLTKERKLHIMFHELWVGMEKGSSIKIIFWSYLQRLILKRNYKLLVPNLVHTQSEFYQLLLRKHEIAAGLLPLFSNIAKTIESSSLQSNLKNLAHDEIHFVLFGTIHSCDYVEFFLNKINSYQHEFSKRIIIKVVGHNGSEINKWKEICGQLGLKLEIYGKQDSKIIANILASSNIGITTTALPMIHKSGTVAAMVEFGMPVICINHLWEPREIDYEYIPIGIYKYSDTAIALCLEFDGNSNLFPGLTNVANAFVTSVTYL